MSRFLNPAHAALKAYVPGEQPQNREYVKLNTNESPYPPAPEVIKTVEAGQAARLNLYPDPEAKDLMNKLAAFYGLKPENVMPGNGSDEILSILFMAFADRVRGVAFPAVSYGFYEVYAELFGVPAMKIPLRPDFSVDPADYFSLTRTIVIANPNAPTGIALTRAEIEQILMANTDCVVAVDEAYVDFGGESCVSLIPKYENLLVIHTYSKSRSLAGARLGYCMGDAALIEDMNRIRYSLNPYNINRLTLAAGAAAIDADGYYAARRAEIQKTRAQTKAALEQRGFTVTDSRANFLFARSDRVSGADYYARLKEMGILIRHFSKPEIADWNRITIGAPEEMQKLIAATDEILGGVK
jgi:histidinol-phosphate aminotransferase